MAERPRNLKSVARLPVASDVTNPKIVRVSDVGVIIEDMIASGAISFEKFQNISSGVLLGRSTAGSGSVEELSVGTGLSLSGGTLSASGSPPTRGTARTLPADVDDDFSSLPSGLSHITVMLAGVSTDGTDPLLLQVGDATGGLKTSGYAASAGDGSADTGSTAGFIVNSASVAASTYRGSVVLNRIDGDQWTVHGALTDGSGANHYFAGEVTLSGDLDRLRLTTTGGADNFDAGKWNWQGN